MATFQDAYNRVMRKVNRPTSEADVLAEAKDAINDAISLLQRNHAFVMTERLAAFTYPANTLTVDLGTICTGKLRNLKSVQEVGTNATFQGKPLKIMTYDQLQAKRGHYERTHNSADPYFSATTLDGWNIEDMFRSDRIAFLSGAAFGLYPTPQQAVNLVLNLNIWMPSLSGNSDTNFFLDYGFDTITKLAHRSMPSFMKSGSEFAPTQEECDASIATLISWDKQIQESSNTSIR